MFRVLGLRVFRCFRGFRVLGFWGFGFRSLKGSGALRFRVLGFGRLLQPHINTGIC